MNKLHHFRAMVQSKKDLEQGIEPHPVIFYSIARSQELALERILSDKNIIEGSVLFLRLDERNLGPDWN